MAADKKLIALLGLLWLGQSLTVSAASFDCRKAQHPVEKAICNNAPLSRADEQLAYAHKTLLQHCPGLPDKAALRAQQRIWVSKTRAGFRGDAAVLAERYDARTRDLQALLADCAKAPSASSLVIETLEDKELDYRLPYITGKPVDAAKRVNDWIFGELFNIAAPVYAECLQILHGENRRVDGRLLTGVDYSVVRNDARLLALSFDVTGDRGNYPMHMLFDARTGRAVHKEDLFTDSGISKLGQQLKDQRLRRGQEIVKALAEVGATDDDELETYETCLREWPDYDADLWHLVVVEAQNWRFDAPSCSGRNFSNEDRLDDLDETYSLSMLAPYLSLYGRSLLLGEGDVRDVLPALSCRKSKAPERTTGTNQPARLMVGWGQHLLLHSDGRLWSWSGDQGVGANADDPRDLDITYLLGRDFVQASAGNGFAAAIRRDGSLWTWGANDSGQLGNGETAVQTHPVRIGSQFKQVKLSGRNALALKDDGSVWTWGGVDGGEKIVYRMTPRQMDGDAVEIGFGYGEQILVLKKDRSLWSWYNLDEGQYGDDDSPPEKIGDGYARLAVHGANLAYKTDGSLWAWGDTLYAADHGSDQSHTHETRLGEFVSVSVGDSGSFVVAVKADGSLWATHYRGQTTRLTSVACGLSDAAVAIDEVKGARVIKVLGLKHDGTLVSWQSADRSGALGPAVFSKPPMTLGKGFARFLKTDNPFVEGEQHSLALSADGSLWEWDFSRVYGSEPSGKLRQIRIDPNP